MPYVNKGLSTKIGPFIKDISGSTITINNQFNDHLLDLKALVTATQSGSGDPSPDNVRPIVGWSSVSVVRCGVNLWDEQWELGGYNSSNGQPYTSYDRIRSKNYITVEGGSSIFFYMGSSLGVLWSLCAYDSNHEFISDIGYNKQNRTINIPNNVRYVRFTLSNSYGTTYLNDVSINYPATTDTDYHAYNGNTYTINLGGTYYGCVLDVTNGVLRVTHANIAIYNGEQINEPWLSSMDKYVSGATPTTGAQVVYPLQTPFEVQLTPTQIDMLAGNNTIFADSGNVEAIYKTFTP